MSYHRPTESQHVRRKASTRLEPTPKAPGPSQGKANSILRLQRTIGNRRVAQLIQAKRQAAQAKKNIQRKTNTDTAIEPYEQEADHVARQLIGQPDRNPVVASRQMAKDDETDKTIQGKSTDPVDDCFEAGADVETQVGLRAVPASLQRQHAPPAEMEFPAEYAFAVDERKRTDKKYAQSLARKDAARIRKSGKLSSEDHEEVAAKLRFFEGDAWAVYGQIIKPALQQVTGGIADRTNLEQDMRAILQDWKRAAIDGVNLFAITALSNRIDDLNSGSWKTFIIALIGNTTWAAAAFTPAGLPAFALSMAGVTIAAGPTIPTKSKSAIPEIQKLMQNYIYSVYEQLNAGLPNNAQLLIKSHPGITRFLAIGEFLQNSFKSGLYNIDKNYGIVPSLKESEVRDLYAQIAADNLDIYTAIGPVPPNEYRINEIAWIEYGGEKKLGMIEVDYFCANGNCPPHGFKKWIPKESETIAIERWKSAPWSQGQIRTFKSADISFQK